VPPLIYSSGSIGFNGCRSLARCQFSSSSGLWAAYHSMTVSECPTREPARDHAVPDAHRDLVLTVRRVEVGRLVIAVEDRDHDTEEAADLRHTPTLSMNRRTLHLRITVAVSGRLL